MVRSYGALRAHDIEALLAGEDRAAALAYLAACSRLWTALEPFAQRLTPAGPADYVARGVAAALAAACQCGGGAGPAMAIVRGTNQLYYDSRSWCAYYGALRGAFVGWAHATPGWAEILNNLNELGD